MKTANDGRPRATAGGPMDVAKRSNPAPGPMPPATHTARASRPMILAILAYALLLPFDLLLLAGRSLAFYAGAAYLTVATLERLSTRAKRRRASFGPSQWAATAYLTLAASSFYWSLAPEATLNTAVVLALLVTTSLALRSDLRISPTSIAVAACIGSTALSMVILAQGAIMYGRRTAFGDPNHIAFSLTWGLACGAFLLINSQRRMVRLSALASMGLIAATLLGVASRTALISIVIILLSALAASIRSRRNIILTWTAAIAAAIIFIANLRSGELNPRLTTDFDALTADGMSNRTDIWGIILDRGLNLWGIGTGAAPEFFTQAIGTPKVAHNVFMGALLELGVIGLGVLITTLATAVRHFNSNPFRDLLWYVVPVTFTFTMTLSGETTRLLWFTIALLWATSPTKSPAARVPAESRAAPRTAKRRNIDHSPAYAHPRDSTIKPSRGDVRL